MKSFECQFYGKIESDKIKLRQWEMQHFHFADADYDLLSCDSCKTISPLILVEKLVTKFAVESMEAN